MPSSEAHTKGCDAIPSCGLDWAVAHRGAQAQHSPLAPAEDVVCAGAVGWRLALLHPAEEEGDRSPAAIPQGLPSFLLSSLLSSQDPPVSGQ